MCERFEENLIRHCAATLAGHKCGSLFCYRPDGTKDTRSQVDALNALLSGKGIRALVLKDCPRGDAVYVYRPSMLRQRLCEKETAAYLGALGYDTADVDACLRLLASRVSCPAFPHEIGLFLDYPLSDVIAFIENGGRNCLCTGCWKVYSNAADAERRFALYRKCRDVYLNCYRRGFAVTHLTVAA